MIFSIFWNNYQNFLWPASCEVEGCRKCTFSPLFGYIVRWKCITKFKQILPTILALHYNKEKSALISFWRNSAVCIMIFIVSHSRHQSWAWGNGNRRGAGVYTLTIQGGLGDFISPLVLGLTNFSQLKLRFTFSSTNHLVCTRLDRTAPTTIKINA
jgi:hypothetical protein